ncbi:fibronectin type III domain-containing protein, partial [Viscerimonas tarda]
MNLPVRLHIKMETMTGVSIETMPNIATVPIFLSGGEMRMLYGEDLKDYFNIDNLQFKGYSKNQYRNTGQLPEGFYRFVVEVRHHTTGRLISNQGMATAWFALGKPPVLKMPVEKAELGAIMGMPVTFSWIPNNVGIPSAGIQYNFELWEMRIPGIDPYVIAQSMPVKYSATQLGTNLVVYPEQLMLDPGMQYAWRVTAFDPFGNIPFDQKGHSQIRTFTYQCQCDAVQNFEAKRDGQDMSFSWTPELNHTSFNIEVENPESGYHTAYSINDAQVKFPDIDFGKTYRLRVQAICNGNRQNPAPFTEWKSLTIPEKPKVADYCPECDCGGEIQPVPVTSNTLRNELKAGDLLTDPYDGGSRYTIKSVIPQGDGAYKGR